MKKNIKIVVFFEVLVMIIVLLNNFVARILNGYIEVVFLVILLFLFYLIVGGEKDRHHLWKYTCYKIIVFLLIFFILYYGLGLIVSFFKTNSYYNIPAFINIIIPILLIIIIKEILRYMILSKAYKDRRIIVLSCICFVFIDLINRCDINTFREKYAIFIFFATIFLPIVSKNILCTYISYNVGYKPVILYLLVTELFGYLIPIIPNPNQYFYAIIWFVMPLIMCYRMYMFFGNANNLFVVERKKNKKRMIKFAFPTIIIGTLIYFVSGYFHYYAIVVASGSMETSINKGDVVIVEKIDGNTDLLELNQVIAYNYNKKIVVHRLVKKINVDKEIIYYTKGDANNDIDSYKVTKDMIIGIVNTKIPYVGYPTVWFNEL